MTLKGIAMTSSTFYCCMLRRDFYAELCTFKHFESAWHGTVCRRSLHVAAPAALNMLPSQLRLSSVSRGH